MTFPPSGFPGGFQGGMPVQFPGGMPGGFPGGFPSGGSGGFPGGFPGGGSSGFPGNFPGGFPGSGSGGFPGQSGGRPSRPSGAGGSVTPPPPSQQTINQFQALRQNPTQAQSMLQQQQGGVTRFAAGCDGRWTTVLLRNGQLFLMYVLSSNVFGNTVGIIWPNYTFGSFPSSAIAAYSCW